MLSAINSSPRRVLAAYDWRVLMARSASSRCRPAPSVHQVLLLLIIALAALPVAVSQSAAASATATPSVPAAVRPSTRCQCRIQGRCGTPDECRQQGILAGAIIGSVLGTVLLTLLGLYIVIGRMWGRKCCICTRRKGKPSRIVGREWLISPDGICVTPAHAGDDTGPCGMDKAPAVIHRVASRPLHSQPASEGSSSYGPPQPYYPPGMRGVVETGAGKQQGGEMIISPLTTAYNAKAAAGPPAYGSTVL